MLSVKARKSAWLRECFCGFIYTVDGEGRLWQTAFISVMLLARGNQLET